MASAIGIRVYRISVHRKRNKALLAFDDDQLQIPAPKFISDFIKTHSAVTQHDEMERSWYGDAGVIDLTDVIEVRAKMKNAALVSERGVCF